MLYKITSFIRIEKIKKIDEVVNKPEVKYGLWQITAKLDSFLQFAIRTYKYYHFFLNILYKYNFLHKSIQKGHVFI
jgi:hypothetical protein